MTDERRAFARQPLKLPARLHAPGGRDVLEGEIQDFCPGGVFVAVRHHDQDYVILDRKQVVADDEVVLGFEAGRGHELRARVAGAIHGGLGLQFLDAGDDAAAIEALAAEAARQAPRRRAAEAIDGLATTGSVADAARAANVLLAVRERFADFVGRGAADLFKSAKDAQFIAARDAGTNAEQTRCMDLMKEIERLERQVSGAFVEEALRTFDDMGGPSQREAPAAESGLALVDTHNFDDWLSVKKIFERLERKQRDAEFELRERISRVAGVRLDEDSDPLGLHAVSIAFHDAIQNLGAGRDARRAIFKAYEHRVAARLDELRAAANDVLRERGVAFDVERPKPTVKRADPWAERPWRPEEADSRARRSERDDVRAPAPAAAAQPSGRGTADARAAPRAGTRERAAPAARSGVDAGAGDSAASGPFPAAPGPELAAPGPELAAPGAEPASPGVDAALPEADVEAAAPAAAPTPPASPPAAGAADTAAPAPAVARASVSAPAESVAVGEAYRAARSMLGLRRAAAAPAAPAPAADAPAEALSPADTRALVEALRALAGSAAPQGEAAPGEIGPLALGERVGDALARAGHRFDARHRDAVEVISSLLDCILRDPLVNDAVKPRIERLSTPLVRVAIDDGAFFGDDAHPARQVVNQLCRLELPAGDPGSASSRTLRGAVDPVIEGLVDGGGETRAFEEAAAALDAVLGEQQAAFEANVRDVVEASERQRSRPRPAHAPPPALAPWIERARRLEVGARLLFATRSGRPHRVSLAWRSADGDTFVFVDPIGNNAGALPIEQLATQLSRGQATLVEGGELPVLDRGWYEMLNAMHRDLAFEATHDPSTGLANRKAFERALSRAIADAGRDGASHAACLFTLETYARIAQECGRRAAETLAAKLGRVLGRQAGERALVARLGESDFAVLLDGASLDRCTGFAADKRHAIEQSRCVFKGRSYDLRVSAGAVAVDARAGSPAAVLDALESARDAARTGATGIEVTEVEAAAAEDAHADEAHPVAAAIEADRLALRAQRIFPLGAEAESRPQFEIQLAVRDEDGTVRGPGALLRAAARAGETAALDRWILDAALEWMAANRAAVARAGGYAINLAAATLEEPGFADHVVARLTESAVPPAKVCFELSGTEGLSSASSASDFVRALREYGCRFSIDDFGTAQGSFLHVKDLPIDYVKIDGMFVRDMLDSPNDLAVVQSIVEIGRFMDKKTIAQAVESEAQLERLRELGVDYAQGFALERPTPLETAG